jgi:hypothetical protein
MRKVIAVLATMPIASAAAGQGIPDSIMGQLPAGYEVLASAWVAAGRPSRAFAIIALGRRDEAADRTRVASARPLFVFERQGGRFVLAGRNDDVVMKADEGGQCDPFLDGDATIATRGRYFTVQNGVACGQHWTDYVTFRLDDQTGGFVFDNERTESWSMNRAPDGDALVRDAPPSVVRDRPHHVTPFAVWRPKK